MHKPESAPLLVKVLGGAAIALCTALGACSDSNGVTPDCTFNVDENGIHAKSDGCEKFSPCLDKNGNPQDAHKCCVDDKGAALTGDDLATCLFGYGAGEPPTTSGGTGGGDGGTN